jgi:hypothetical protein
MNDEKPRPNINYDKEYIDKVNSLIVPQAPIEEIHFEYLTEALASLGIEVDLFQGYTVEEVSIKIKEVVNQSFEIVSKETLSDQVLVKICKLWDYLAEEDDLHKADLIYVYGGISEHAVNEAIRLKLEDYAPKIMFSGKKASYMKDVEITEAEKYAQMAIEHGVKDEDILIEKKSINTVENIVFSAKLLHSMNWLPKKVIVVSLPYHTRRAALTMKGGFDWRFELIRHPGKSAKYTRENYYRDKNGWSYVCFEYFKLFAARQMGHF